MSDSVHSPKTARKLIEPVITRLLELHSAAAHLTTANTTSSSTSPTSPMSTIEIRTYSFDDSKHVQAPGAIGFVIEVSGRLTTLVEQAPRLLRTLHSNMETIVKESRAAYLPNVPYDKYGSTVRRLANDYVIVRHVVIVSDVDEAEIHGRMELVDIMLEDGWQLLAQASHNHGNSPGVSTGASLNPATVIETWIKRR